MKILRCREVGFNCDHEIRAHSEEEVLLLAAEHAKTTHGAEATPELVAKVKANIHDEPSQ